MEKNDNLNRLHHAFSSLKNEEQKRLLCDLFVGSLSIQCPKIYWDIALTHAIGMYNRVYENAPVAEMADATDLKSVP